MSDDAHDLSPETTQPVFLVTTENAVGRSIRRMLFGFLSVMGLLLIAVVSMKVHDAEARIGHGELRAADGGDGTRRADTTFTRAVGVAAIGAGLGYMLLLCLLFRFGVLRGAWVLDSRGIEFQLLRGKGRMLEWIAVQAVAQLWSDQIWFRGKGVKVILWLAYTDR